MQDNLLSKTHQVFQSEKGTNLIYDGTYLSVPAYIIEHTPTGHIEIIDHTEQAYLSVVGRIKRSSALTCNQNKRGYFLKFPSHGRKRSISLRLYIYAKYKGMRLSEVRGKKIELDDDSAIEYGIQDLRSCNLYDAGEIRPYTKARAIEKVSICGNDYIKITINSKPDGRPEYAEYSLELYEMLARPTYTRISYNSNSGRSSANIHYGRGKKCYQSVSLGKLILLYYTYFDKYKNMTGSIKRFISDFPKLAKEHAKDHAAHINSCKWIHTRNNLMFMSLTDDSNPNSKMSDYIKYFDNSYRVFPVVNDAGEIIMSVNTPFREEITYIKFRTPQGFCDFQLMFQGRADYKKFAMIGTGTGAFSTPSAQINAGVVSLETAKNNEPAIKEWHESRDELLAVSGDQFITWEDHTPWAILTMIVNGGEQFGFAWILINGDG